MSSSISYVVDYCFNVFVYDCTLTNIFNTCMSYKTFFVSFKGQIFLGNVKLLNTNLLIK